MYAIIRCYRMGAGSIDAMAQRVDKEFANRVPEEVGAVLYMAIDTGDDTAMTVTLFETEDAGRRSEAAVVRVRESLAEFQVEETDVFKGEVMVSRAADKVLEPVHQLTNLAGSAASSRAASSRSHTIAYGITTMIIATELTVGGVWDILRIPRVREVIEHLGYPTYFLVIMGIWKIPGAVALLVPRFPRLKEWAYAGAVFNYTAAAASHLVIGDVRPALNPIIFTGITLASWALRPSSRRDLAPNGGSWRVMSLLTKRPNPTWLQRLR